jgi:hypothetical protein
MPSIKYILLPFLFFYLWRQPTVIRTAKAKIAQIGFASTATILITHLGKFAIDVRAW